MLNAKNVERDSNFELLRIVAMLMIIGHWRSMVHLVTTHLTSHQTYYCANLFREGVSLVTTYLF